MTKTSEKFSIKDDFTLLALLLVPVAVAVNFVGGQIATGLKLPFYLDTIGTILVAMLCGPWVGGAAGLVTNLVLGVANPIFFPYAAVNLAVGLVTGFCSRKKGFSTWPRASVSILLMAIISILISTPITVILFGGITDSGTSLITATLVAVGADLWAAAFGTDLVFTVIDRVASVVLTFLVIKVIPARTLVRFSCGENYLARE